MIDKSILFLTDSSFDYDYLAKKIELPDITFEIASTNAIAENILKTKKCLAILGNYFVKGFSYRSLVNFIKDNKNMDDIPIVLMLTQKEADDNLKKLYEISDDFILKPFSLELLRIKLQSTIKKKEKIDTLKHSLQMIEDANNTELYQEKINIFREITTNVANEIKDPINFTKNFSEIAIRLANSIKTDNNKNMTKERYSIILKKLIENLNIIYKYSIKLDSFIQFLLNQSNLRAGDKIKAKITTLLDLTYQSAITPFQKALGRRKIIYETNYDVWNQRITIDIVNIQRAFSLIFNNAIEALLEKNNDVDVYKITVSSIFDKKEKQLIIKITDNGVGISKNVLPNIFKPFFSTKLDHHGLGLSTASEIVEKIHSGTIGVISNNGEFTTVSVMIPTTSFENEQEILETYTVGKAGKSKEEVESVHVEDSTVDEPKQDKDDDGVILNDDATSADTNASAPKEALDVENAKNKSTEMGKDHLDMNDVKDMADMSIDMDIGTDIDADKAKSIIFDNSDDKMEF